MARIPETATRAVIDLTVQTGTPGVTAEPVRVEVPIGPPAVVP